MPPDGVVPNALAGCRRILLMRLDNIGDVIMLGPAVRAIRRSCPDAWIGLLASPAGAAAAPLLPWLDEVRSEQVVWQDNTGLRVFDPDGERAVIGRLASGHWDAALIFTSFSQTPFAAAYAAYLAGIPRRAAQAAEFGGAILTHQVEPVAREAHQVDRNLRLVEGLGIDVADRAPAIEITTEGAAQAGRLLAEADLDPGQPYVLVVPGASCSSRRYPAERFGVAAARLRAATGYAVIVAGTGREQPLAAEVAAAIPGARSFAGRTTVPGFASLIARASLVISGNTSSLHLADALRRPVVALYAGTDLESQWAPRHTASALLRRDTPCHPCYRFTCPYSMECLDIEPNAVVDAALGLLDLARPTATDGAPAAPVPMKP